MYPLNLKALVVIAWKKRFVTLITTDRDTGHENDKSHFMK